jgi:Ca-activated chloride channel family protein
MKGRLVVAGTGLVAVLVIAAFTTSSPTPVRISFVSSPEKENLMRPLVSRFNDAGVKLDGHPVKVDLRIGNSGDVETAIAEGQMEPDVWSPASSLWARLLDEDSSQKNLVPMTNPSIVRTPLVIAMWKRMAEALGWPKKPISLRQVLDLATSGRGWAGVGHPTFGPFKLGHTDPDVSTSGLSAVVGEYYAESGTRSVSASQLHDARLQDAIKAIEQSVVHYGDTTLSFAEQLQRYGPAYASAVAMEETTLVQANTGKHGPYTGLVAIYPSEGTFFSDSPFIVLRGLWVTPEKRQAAELFRLWLKKNLTPAIAAKQGFRSATPGTSVPPPLRNAPGVNPAEPAKQLPLPSPSVLASIRNDWRDHRKPANVMLVLDNSAAMDGGGKLTAAHTALSDFVSGLPGNDSFGIVSFNGGPVVLSPPKPLAGQRGGVLRVVHGFTASGDSWLYAATKTALNELTALRDPSRINAIVVLAAGNDNRSAPAVTESSLATRLERQARAQGLAVGVYTIAYGPSADPKALANIAGASRGFAFESTPKELESTLNTIASYF